jgi:hypothetical protein
MRLSYILLIFFTAFSLSLSAQKNKSPFDLKYNYYGLGWALADDNANVYPDFSGKSVNYVNYPSMIIFGKAFENSIRLEASAFYTQLNKSVYGSNYSNPGAMASFDVNIEYLLDVTQTGKNSFLSKKKNDGFSMEVYPLLGGGYTYRSLNNDRFVNSCMFNIGGGMTAWLFKNRIGANFQSFGKFGVKSDFPSSGANYIQYTFSILYRMRNLNNYPSNMSDGRKKS